MLTDISLFQISDLLSVVPGMFDSSLSHLWNCGFRKVDVGGVIVQFCYMPELESFKKHESSSFIIIRLRLADTCTGQRNHLFLESCEPDGISTRRESPQWGFHVMVC